MQSPFIISFQKRNLSQQKWQRKRPRRTAGKDAKVVPFTETAFAPKTFDTRNLYTKSLLGQTALTPNTFYTRNLLHHTALTPKTFLSQNSSDIKNIFSTKLSTPNSFDNKKLEPGIFILPKKAMTPNTFFAKIVFCRKHLKPNLNSCDANNLYTRSSVYAADLFHQMPSTPHIAFTRNLVHQKLLSIYAGQLLHRIITFHTRRLPPKPFYRKQL